MKNPAFSRQSGATLLEVLVTVLILSFGMLALGGMMAYAIQLPKMSGNRATAMMLAASHVERMRANTAGFSHRDLDDPRGEEAEYPAGIVPEPSGRAAAPAPAGGTAGQPTLF